MECSNLTHIYIAKTLSQAIHVHAVPLRVHTIIFSTVQDTMYVNIRETYLHIYPESHNTHELLRGEESASDLENEALFLNVQEFIVKSKRFA